MKYGGHVICPSYLQRSVLPRLATNVDVVGECLVWRGKPDDHGYGRIQLVSSDGVRVTARVHRVVMALFYGLSEQEVDHECRNRLCVNIEHLKVVSGLQNTRLMRRRRRMDGGQLELVVDERYGAV